MTRSLATAVLWAVSSLFSLSDADGVTFDADDAGDPIIELSQSSASSTRGEPAGLLAEASVLCGEPIDHAWVIELPDQRRVAVAVREHGDTAYLSFATGVGARDAMGVAEELLAKALSHCREAGVLKVVLHSEKADHRAMVRMVEAQGCTYSRIRRLEGGEAMEFYLNLYWHAPDRRRQG